MSSREPCAEITGRKTVAGTNVKMFVPATSMLLDRYSRNTYSTHVETSMGLS
jgi:hypothetical protein